jgi:hypothetical protein
MRIPSSSRFSDSVISGTSDSVYYTLGKNSGEARLKFSALKLAPPLNELLQHILAHHDEVGLRLGKYEADMEAYKLLLLATKHAKSVITLAYSETGFEPSGSVLARACQEAGTRALWLLSPNDPFERESRWITHIISEADARRRIEEMMGRGNEGSQSVRSFASAVKDKLPNGYEPPKKLPNIRAMLESIGHVEKYLVYIRSSQFSHGTSYGTGVFQKNLGTEKQIGNFEEVEFWELTIGTCWWFVILPAIRLSELAGLPNILAPVNIQEQYVLAQRSNKRPTKPSSGRAKGEKGSEPFSLIGQ